MEAALTSALPGLLTSSAHARMNQMGGPVLLVSLLMTVTWVVAFISEPLLMLIAVAVATRASEALQCIKTYAESYTGRWL